MGKKLEAVFAKMSKRPWPICHNCGRCFIVGRCCDKPDLRTDDLRVPDKGTRPPGAP